MNGPSIADLPLVTPEEADEISKISSELCMATIPLARKKPLFALAALTLATTQVAMILGVSCDEVVLLVTKQYENQLMNRLQEEVEASGRSQAWYYPNTVAKG